MDPMRKLELILYFMCFLMYPIFGWCSTEVLRVDVPGAKKTPLILYLLFWPLMAISQPIEDVGRRIATNQPWKLCAAGWGACLLAFAHLCFQCVSMFWVYLSDDISESDHIPWFYSAGYYGWTWASTFTLISAGLFGYTHGKASK